MNYPELCERLIRETGFADVYYAKYSHLGTGATKREPEVILWVEDGIFDVGNEDETRGDWVGINDVEFATAEWVDWYNERRLHGELGHIPPAEFEAAYWASTTQPVLLETR